MGKCGKHNGLQNNTINSLRTSILHQSGIDVTKYTSHAIRGNSEGAIVWAAMNGASFSEKEALIRARHSLETHLKSYQRPADPAFIQQIHLLKRSGKLADMTPEEVLRVEDRATGRRPSQRTRNT